MTNQISPNTQLDRVFNAINDGVWRSPAEIAALTGDDVKSISSRLRDLRLPKYGNHQIDIRKRDAANQIWEYRLAPSSGHMMGGNVAVPGTAVGVVTPLQNPQVRFLNTLTMQPEYVPQKECAEDTSAGFKRVVALDDNGEIIPYLVTTQCDL